MNMSGTRLKGDLLCELLYPQKVIFNSCWNRFGLSASSWGNPRIVFRLEPKGESRITSIMRRNELGAIIQLGKQNNEDEWLQGERTRLDQFSWSRAPSRYASLCKTYLFAQPRDAFSVRNVTGEEERSRCRRWRESPPGLSARRRRVRSTWLLSRPFRSLQDANEQRVRCQE